MGWGWVSERPLWLPGEAGTRGRGRRERPGSPSDAGGAATQPDAGDVKRGGTVSGVKCQPPGVGAEMENTDGVWGFGAVSGGGREIVSWVLDTRSLRCLGSTPAEELGVSWCFFPLHCP